MIYEIKITLENSRPKIWRQVKINPDISLNDLHKIIQTTMGWENSHLHQFISGRTFYGNPDNDALGEMNLKDSKAITVAQILNAEGESIIYEYDFGDGWEHEVKLVKIYEDENLIHPNCIAGEKNCPPEDSGGVWGYAEKLKILKNKNHEEHDDILEWMGEAFDPNSFDMIETNKMLAEKDFGCLQAF